MTLDKKEQARITRQRNAEARKARQAERYAQEKKDRALVLEALRGVLQDPNATAEQRLYAVAVLDNMQHYYFVPHDVRHPLQTADTAKIDAEIRERLERLKNE